MRIACVLIPALPIQVAVQKTPGLAGTPFVVTSGSERPLVAARSRAANAQGIVPGMPVVTARRRCPDLVVLPPALDDVEAVTEALLQDLARHGAAVHLPSRPHGGMSAFFVEVPARVASKSFARQLTEVAQAHGLVSRVGVAGDYFTSMIAAETASTRSDQLSLSGVGDAPGVAVIPQGQSREFLSRQPLARLPLPGEVRDMLEHLGVRTVGQFAELPPPTIHRRSPESPDVHALARGDGPLLPPGPRRTLRASRSARLRRATGSN